MYPPYGMNIYALAEHLPLEQGLRQEEMGSILSLDFTLAEHLPLEQGLRQERSSDFFFTSTLAEHLPLEQGLRLGYALALQSS